MAAMIERARKRLSKRASWAGANSAARRSATAWPRSPRCSNICARRTRSPTIRSRASSGREPKAAKARRRRSATIRRVSCSKRPPRTRSRASATAPLKVKDFRHARKGVPHLKVSGKGGKTRYLPLHPGTHGLINDYLDAAGHGTDENGALFRAVRNNRTGRLERAITADGVYRIVRGYSAQ